MEPGSAAERRRFHRYPVRVEAAYEDTERQVFVTTRDLSEGGGYFETPELPPVGRAARVTLQLPEQVRILRIRGHVIRRENGPVTGFALQFDPRQLNPGDRRQLLDFLEDRLPRGM